MAARESEESSRTLLEPHRRSITLHCQRARKSVEVRTEDAAPPEAASPDAALLRRFITAWESGDLDAFSALLADDALFSMPPQHEWFAGREAITRFFELVWSALRGALAALAPRSFAFAFGALALTTGGLCPPRLRLRRTAPPAAFGALALVAGGLCPPQLRLRRTAPPAAFGALASLA